MADPTLDNLWYIKVVLRSFKKVSGIHINFFKISLVVVNVNFTFLALVGDFIHCEIAFLPFKFLGLSVRVNPLLSLLRNLWLSYWKEDLILRNIDMWVLKVERLCLIWCLMLFLYSTVLYENACYCLEEDCEFLNKVCLGGEECVKNSLGELVNLTLLVKWRRRLLVGDSGL